jgi:hypothetical protein
MRVLLPTYVSSGDVEPMMGLSVQLGVLGAEVRVCAPVTKATPPSLADLPPRAATSLSPSSPPSPRRPRNVMRRSRPP